MGKSIRSKSTLRAKSIKRLGEFTKHVDERNKRIADKLALAKEQQLATTSKTDKKPSTDDKMDEDSDKLVSTSGWKSSRKSIYKQSKLKNKKKKNHMKF